jgi:hypothetical protein
MGNASAFFQAKTLISASQGFEKRVKFTPYA